MPNKPKADPDDHVLLAVPVSWVHELDKICNEDGVSREDLILQVLEERLFGKPEELSTGFLALMAFASHVPFEVCIKVARSKEKKIVYLWANARFLEMTGGGLELKDIQNKTVKEVWNNRDPARANHIHKEDLEVLKTGRVKVHTVLQGGEIGRPRVRVLFPMGDPHTKPEVYLGTIGMDFKDDQTAEAFCEALRIGDWQAQLRPKKKRPR